MTALTLNQEFGQMRVRFRRTLVISAGLHVLLFGWLFLNRQWAPVPETIVEITWLEQVSQPKPVLIKPEPEKIKAVVTKAKPIAQPSIKEKLARNDNQSEVLREKMSALKPAPEVSRALSVRSQISSSLLNTSLATMAPITRNQTPVNLNRGGGSHEPAVALKRGTTSSATAATLPTLKPNTGSTNAQAATGAETVRTLGGATLTGLVADRQVLEHPMPGYPAWATTEGVEATVTLYFLVLASGRVKENVQIQKTAGAVDFDRNAVAALRQWRFEALSGQATKEQWGTITFRYRLNN